MSEFWAVDVQLRNRLLLKLLVSPHAKGKRYSELQVASCLPSSLAVGKNVSSLSVQAVSAKAQQICRRVHLEHLLADGTQGSSPELGHVSAWTTGSPRPPSLEIS